jgi:uncharacterized protein YdhG (YjbR/CyaY superfamily)
MAARFGTVDEYIASFPADVQELLRGVRRAVRAALPDAPEDIRYGMPAVMLGRREAVYFAAWKHHIAIYPVARSDDPIEEELAPYRAAKDTLRFPLKRPIPTT